MLSYFASPTLSVQTLEFLPDPFKHWTSYLILLSIEILPLSFGTLEFLLDCLPYRFKLWKSYLFLLNIGLSTISF